MGTWQQLVHATRHAAHLHDEVVGLEDAAAERAASVSTAVGLLDGCGQVAVRVQHVDDEVGLAAGGAAAVVHAAAAAQARAQSVLVGLCALGGVHDLGEEGPQAACLRELRVNGT